MAQILITGGRGFIGTNLLAQLRQRGHDVSTCDISPGEDEQHHRIDVSEYQQLEEHFRISHYDYVYHLAAEYGRHNGEDHYQNLWRTNVIGTKNLLRIQQRERFRMIFFSSAEVYGDYDDVMSEDVMERVPIKQMNDYAISKWAGEMQCLNHTEMYDTEIVRVRPVGCYGPHEYYSPYRGVIPIFVYHAIHGRPFTVHRGHRRIFDFVEDTCRTFANIVENFRPGEVYNVGGREEWDISIEELADIVVEATDCNRDLMTHVGAEDFTTRVKQVDFSKARQHLGHDPQIDIDAGIRRYVAWMRQVYQIDGSRCQPVPAASSVGP